MLHIAFAKGRIAKTVMKNLAAAGFNFPTYDDDSRKLIFTDETGMLKDRKSTRLNSSHNRESRMPSSA